MVRGRLPAAAGAAIVMLTTVGCTVTRSVSDSRPPSHMPSASRTIPTPAPAVQQTLGLFGDNLRLDPPAGQAPKLSVAQALTSLCRLHSPMCSRSTHPSVALGLLTTSGGYQSTSDVFVPDANRLLSYVFSWTGVPCLLLHDPVAKPRLCTQVQAVNADTGALVSGLWQGDD